MPVRNEGSSEDTVREWCEIHGFDLEEMGDGSWYRITSGNQTIGQFNKSLESGLNDLMPGEVRVYTGTGTADAYGTPLLIHDDREIVIRRDSVPPEVDDEEDWNRLVIPPKGVDGDLNTYGGY